MSIIKGTNQIVAGFGGTKRSIGEVYFSQSALATDNSGALPLFTGETIASANTIYPEFYNWVTSHTELQCTSEEYESSLSTYGECAKYVIGDGSLRLPLIKNYIKAANPSEGIKNIEAGLPNITGGIRNSHVRNNVGSADCGYGAVEVGPNRNAYTGNFSESSGSASWDFDASRSSSIYGKSSTVTPASTTLYPWVVAYTAAIPASTAQAAEFQQALSGKVDLPAGKTQVDVDFVVESYSDENGSWYRKYKSGWLEQGGRFKTQQPVSGRINFLKPYSTTLYSIQITANTGSGTVTMAVQGTTNTTGFTYIGSDRPLNGFSWSACGKSAS